MKKDAKGTMAPRGYAVQVRPQRSAIEAEESAGEWAEVCAGSYPFVNQMLASLLSATMLEGAVYYTDAQIAGSIVDEAKGKALALVLEWVPVPVADSLRELGHAAWRIVDAGTGEPVRHGVTFDFMGEERTRFDLNCLLCA